MNLSLISVSSTKACHFCEITGEGGV